MTADARTSNLNQDKVSLSNITNRGTIMTVAAALPYHSLVAGVCYQRHKKRTL